MKNTTDNPRAVACIRFVRLWWWCKARLWLWRWGRWLKRVHRMEPSAALIEITRYKWLVTHAGYSEKWEDVFLRALTITEESIRSKPNDEMRDAMGGKKAMKTEPTTDAHGVPLHRLVRRCRCKYQSEKSWGYDLCEWVGGRKSWKNHGSATHPEDIVKYAADKKLKTILVRCNGCGADVLREYPANDQILPPATGGTNKVNDDEKR